MVLTPWGRVSSFRLVQPLKVEPPMVVRRLPSAKLTVSRAEQPKKAKSGRLVIPASTWTARIMWR